jgi:IS1 family transposase
VSDESAREPEPEPLHEAWPPLVDIENNDLLINDLYSKERGHRVVVLGIQLDEMWSFVQQKQNKQWLWLALNPVNKQIIAFHIGSRSGRDAALLEEKIPSVFKQQAGFFSDYWPAYRQAFAAEIHVGVGKASGLTAGIERFKGLPNK